MAAKPMCVFIGLRELAGNNQALCQGLQQLGVDAQFVNWYGGSSYVGQGVQNPLVLWARQLAPRKDFLGKLGCSLCRRLIFIWALFRFDVFFFSTDQTFISGFKDLLILKALGKRVIVQFHGTDSRPPYMNAATQLVENMLNSGELKQQSYTAETIKRLKALARKTADKFQRMQVLNRYADVLIDCEEHGHFHTQKFVNRPMLGRPTVISQHMAVAEPTSKNTLLVLHCPSRRKGKGSPWVKQGLEQLAQQGYPVAYLELTGVSQSQVVAAMQQADVVIDQLFDDIGYSGIAVEAALVGRPVLLSGYNAQRWRQLSQQGVLPPFAYATPDNWLEVLKPLLQSADQREQLTQATHQFVTTQWTLPQVAQRYLKVLQGDIPEQWWVQPIQLTYAHGWGLAQPELELVLKAYHQVNGPEAFKLIHAPLVYQHYRDAYFD